MSRVVASIYFTSWTLLFIVGGGLLCGRLSDVPSPTGDDRPGWGLVYGTFGLFAGAVIGSGYLQWRRHRRRFWFGNILFSVWLPLSICVVEGVFRGSTPSWPALALHGVDPAVSRSAWGQSLPDDDIGFNSWGQRDRERSLKPDAGIERIAFLGDSFLEESSHPISLIVERLLDRADCEIINFGVSSTQPDEYYYRLRTVALPLGCRHCVVWFFSGNDFVDEPRTLSSRWGLCAVAPRPSLLTNLSCRSINHILTNKDRPVIQAWFAAGDLAARESQMFTMVRQADDDAVRRALLHSSPLPPEAFARLKARLYSPESAAFLSMLRRPDSGKFRSYYLTAGLWSAAVGNGQWDRNPETQALYWAGEMQNLCQRRGVKLTFVVIPEAFQVDRRMRTLWSGLTDMRHLTEPCRKASERFCAAARQNGWDVLDLHTAFEDAEGTYLNLDGHWSETGVNLAARTVLDHLHAQLSSR
jgi:acetyltransferase AlgX (SGNH hydrolase-like protein)